MNDRCRSGDIVGLAQPPRTRKSSSFARPAAGMPLPWNRRVTMNAMRSIFDLPVGLRTVLVVIAILTIPPAIAHNGQIGAKVKITANYYRVKAPIDTQSIKAIGSAQTKATP